MARITVEGLLAQVPNPVRAGAARGPQGEAALKGARPWSSPTTRRSSPRCERSPPGRFEAVRRGMTPVRERWPTRKTCMPSSASPGRLRRRNKEGVPEARPQAPPRPQPRQQAGRGALQGDLGRAGRPDRSREAQGLRRVRARPACRPASTRTRRASTSAGRARRRRTTFRSAGRWLRLPRLRIGRAAAADARTQERGFADIIEELFGRASRGRRRRRSRRRRRATSSIPSRSICWTRSAASRRPSASAVRPVSGSAWDGATGPPRVPRCTGTGTIESARRSR
jgi:hypothetical protein